MKKSKPTEGHISQNKTNSVRRMLKLPDFLIRNSDMSLHKHTAALETASGGLEFVHAYHEDFVNAFLHVLSMPVYVHSLIIVPLTWLSPFSPDITRDLFTFVLLIGYLPVDSWGAITYAIFSYWVFSVGIYFHLYDSFLTSLLAAVVGAVEIMITQVLLGHNLFQGFNASFEIREAYLYTPFYFVLRFLRWFGYSGHEEEFQRETAPHDVPIGQMGVLETPNKVFNHCQNSQSLPSKVFFPSTENDVKDIVDLARKINKRVRVIGKGHTFNKIALCDDGDLLVRTDWLREIRIDVDRRVAFVQPGVTVGELDEALAKHNLCVPTNVILTSVTWGGITQTGSHGSGHAPICEWVQSIKFVDGIGQIRKLRRGIDPEFQVVVQGFGTCGLLIELEVSVEPDKTLEVKSKLCKSWPTASDVKRLFDVTDQIEVFFNLDGRAVVRTLTKTDKKPSMQNELCRTAFSTFCHWGNPIMRIISKMNGLSLLKWCYPRFLARYNYVGPTHKAVHYMRRIQDILVLSNEFAMPLQDLDTAIGILKEMIIEYEAKGVMTGLMLGEARVTPSSDTLMFAGKKAGKEVAWFEIIGFTSPEFRAFTQDFVGRVLKSIPAAFPHWAKDLTVIEPKALQTRIHSVFGNDLETFNDTRKKMDPEGLFLNGFLETILAC